MLRMFLQSAHFKIFGTLIVIMITFFALYTLYQINFKFNQISDRINNSRIEAMLPFLLDESTDEGPVITLLDSYIPTFFHQSAKVSWKNHQLIAANETQLQVFEDAMVFQEKKTTGTSDREAVDALEHFFWGQIHGIAVELGALDGSDETSSQTVVFERLGWKRMLIEGNPSYASKRVAKCSNALGINAVICENSHTPVHFIDKPYVGGIVEYMSHEFLNTFHPEIFQASSGNGKVDLSIVDWEQLKSVLGHEKLKEVQCLTLKAIFNEVKLSRINFFILDVEGAEIEVLKTIDWSAVIFDVLCIETEPLTASNMRPNGFADSVKAFLEPHGYRLYRDGGRNSWFTHSSFTPSRRHDPYCFRGLNMSWGDQRCNSKKS